MTAEQLASLAASLRDNEAFQSALGGLRADALEALGRVDPDDKNAILAQQAIVNVVDSLRDRFDTMIRAGKAPKKPGLP